MQKSCVYISNCCCWCCWSCCFCEYFLILAALGYKGNDNLMLHVSSIAKRKRQRVFIIAFRKWALLHCIVKQQQVLHISYKLLSRQNRFESEIRRQQETIKRMYTYKYIYIFRMKSSHFINCTFIFPFLFACTSFNNILPSYTVRSHSLRLF